MIPIRIGEHRLQALFVGLGHRLFHTLHVLAPRLHQSFEVIACGLKDRAGLALEMIAIAPMEAQKTRGHLINRANACISIVK